MKVENPYAPPRAPADEAPPAGESAIAVSIFCSTCPSKVRIGDERCGGCGREITADEKRALQQRWEASDPDVARAADDSYWGRVAIGAGAGLATLQTLVSLESPALALWGGAVSLALWALFAWSFRQPRLACGVALFIYVVWWVAPLAFAPLALLDGVLFKALTLTALMGGFAAETSLHNRRRRAATTSRPPPGKPHFQAPG